MVDLIKDLMTNSLIPLWGWVLINLILWGTILTVLIKFGGMILRIILTFFLPYWTD